MYIGNRSFSLPHSPFSLLLLYAMGKRTPGMLASLRRIQLDSQSSVDNASIVARLDGDDSGEASLGIIRFVPISSPSRLPSAFSPVYRCHLRRYRFYFYYSPTSPLIQFLRSRTIAHRLLGGTEGFGKTWLSDRTAPLCYR